MIAARSQPGHRVLVVDDEAAIADTLKLILEQSGYETRAVYSGEAAVELLSDFQPDMLIADVIMPGITGIQAALQVLATLPSCKILLISGNEKAAVLLEESSRDKNRGFELLAKPFHPTELLAKMSSALSN
jgi:CheY-like chemotaxis protein